MSFCVFPLIDRFQIYPSARLVDVPVRWPALEAKEGVHYIHDTRSGGFHAQSRGACALLGQSTYSVMSLYGCECTRLSRVVGRNCD
jgi:hypothetical protein